MEPDKEAIHPGQSTMSQRDFYEKEERLARIMRPYRDENLWKVWRRMGQSDFIDWSHAQEELERRGIVGKLLAKIPARLPWLPSPQGRVVLGGEWVDMTLVDEAAQAQGNGVRVRSRREHDATLAEHCRKENELAADRRNEGMRKHIAERRDAKIAAAAKYDETRTIFGLPPERFDIVLADRTELEVSIEHYPRYDKCVARVEKGFIVFPAERPNDFPERIAIKDTAGGSHECFFKSGEHWFACRRALIEEKKEPGEFRAASETQSASRSNSPGSPGRR